MAIRLNGEAIGIADLDAWLTADSFELSPKAQAAVRRARNTVESILADGRTVYGLNTGFGKFSETRISDDSIVDLQHRLVMSHACGIGSPMPESISRLMMLLKVQSLIQGHSGCHPDIVTQLIRLLNGGVIPAIPEKGSVGASGDLAPLAHLALVLMGEGECLVDGRIQPAADVLKKTDIQPITFQAKDGLAVLNGTQAIVAYLSYALIQLRYLIPLADVVAALSMEALTATSRAFDARIHQLRNHPGQMASAAHLRQILDGSTLIDSRNQVQDAYSLRCTSQVHGAVRDTFTHVKQVAEREINGVTDNPLVFPESGDVISGGNFHGEPVAVVSDYIAIATAELASISERRIAHLIDPHVSHLPAFLVRDGGINSGYMIPQYTAAALVSENKVLCHPASVDSIPTSANKEDHVSMGTHAARKLCDVVENTTHVLGIELLAAVQGIELNQTGKPSPTVQKVVDAVRESIPHWAEDRFMKVDLDAAYSLIKKRQFDLDLLA